MSDKEKARERLKMNIARRIERYRRRKWLGRVAGILTIIQNSFDIMGVNSFYKNIIKGIIILLAGLLDLRGKKKKN